MTEDPNPPRLGVHTARLRQTRKAKAQGAVAAPGAASADSSPSKISPVSELQRLLLDKGPPACIVDQSGSLLYGNRGFKRIARALQAVGAVPGYRAEGGEWMGGADPRRSHDGEEFKLNVNDRAEHYRRVRYDLGDEAGSPGATAYLFEPITKVKTLANALVQATTRLDDMTRLVSDWVWETDPDLVLTFVSPRITDALGFHPLEIVGLPLDELPSKPSAELKELVALKSRSPFRSLEVEIDDNNGVTHIFRISGLPVYSPEGGAFLGLRGTAEDVTDLRSREGALVEAKEGAELANRTKTEFLANMSHELRTPLNAVIGFSELMESELLGPLGNPQYKSYAQDIHASAEHLLNLINDILDASKVEAAGHKLHEAAASPYEICDSAVRLVAERARHAGQTLELRLPPGLPELWADTLKLKQVLLNLLANAVKFTPEGGAIDLTVTLDSSGDFLFLVSDSGVGIAAADMERAFSPFEQVDNSLNRGREGTGLGLAISRAFMEMHDGTLVLESEPGVGTKAIARLPAGRVRRG